MSAGAALAVVLAALQGAAPSPPPAPVRAEAKEWVVSAGPRAAGAGSAAVDLQLTARAGYHVNLDYPMAFAPSPDATAVFAGARVPLRPVSTAPCQGDGKDVCSVSLVLPYAPPADGPARVAGVFAFSVCSAERCLIQKVPLSLAAAPPAAPRN